MNELMRFHQEQPAMGKTSQPDQKLLAKARRLAGIKEDTAPIKRESARRLARLGGSEPQLAAAPRRRPEPV